MNKELKKLIFNQYLKVHKIEKHKFEAIHGGLAPLSEVIASIFDSLSNREMLDAFSMLGTRSIENYSEDLMKVLFDKFTSPAYI